MICGGFIIAGDIIKHNAHCYAGVNANAWPLELRDCISDASKQLLNICETNMFQPFLIGAEEASVYMTKCRELGIAARVLYCEVDTGAYPIEPWVYPLYCGKKYFLGIDYAYPNGDYFSVCANEMLLQKTSFHCSWQKRLNQNGLFNEQKEFEWFLKERVFAELLPSSKVYFEKGPFMKYLLYSVVL